MEKIVVVSNDATVYVSTQHLAELLEAELIVYGSDVPAELPSADVLLWHTVFPYDTKTYALFTEQYRIVLLLLERGRGERLGSGERIDVPYLIFPFDPLEAMYIIKRVGEKNTR